MKWLGTLSTPRALAVAAVWPFTLIVVSLITLTATKLSVAKTTLQSDGTTAVFVGYKITNWPALGLLVAVPPLAFLGLWWWVRFRSTRSD